MQKRFANVQTAQSSAKLGITLGLIGVPICCAPLSIIGGVLGFRSLRLAKAEGIPAPTQAFIAIGAAVVSTLLLAGAIVLGGVDAREKQERLEHVQARLAGRREAPALDSAVACSLIEERLLEDGYANTTTTPGAVHCDGAVEPSGIRAKMKDVASPFRTSPPRRPHAS